MRADQRRWELMEDKYIYSSGLVNPALNILILKHSNIDLPSNGDSEVKECQHFRSDILDKHITDDRWCNCRVARLPDANHSSADEEPFVVGHETPDDCENSPDEDSKCHDEFSGVPIAQISEDGCEDHVRDDKGGLQGTTLRIADVIFILNLGQDS